jgi:hypothetical protein
VVSHHACAEFRFVAAVGMLPGDVFAFEKYLLGTSLRKTGR